MIKIKTLTGEIIDPPGPKPNVITIYNKHSLQPGEEEKQYCEGAEAYFKNGVCYGCNDSNEATCYDISSYKQTKRSTDSISKRNEE